MRQLKQPQPRLPASAYLPINRCNLPAAILGNLTFQRHPAMLEIDGVNVLHRALFFHLDKLESATERAHLFGEYMTAHFQLTSLEAAGYRKNMRIDRSRADYRNSLLGWHFDAEGREGAVLKAWVESRFGLLPRYHNGPIRAATDVNYRAYLAAYAEGIYNTNALEAQLDVVYAYCQYELRRSAAGATHKRLYRGVNRLEEFEILKRTKRTSVVILNNLNSFTDSIERAEEFGDYVLETDVPLAKIFYFSELLPLHISGENEHLVIGGLYETAFRY